MTKLADVLVTAPGSLIKDADVESPDEAQLEQDFANMALVFLRDRAPGLMPSLLGFEVVDREEDGSRAVGIFGFKISGNYYYVPVFFVNQQIKGMDLLFSKKTNSFVPLRETWINKILDRSTLRLGEGQPGNIDMLRQDFETPDFDFAARPPYGIGGAKMAGLNHLFDAAELVKFGMVSAGPQPTTMPPAPMPNPSTPAPAPAPMPNPSTPAPAPAPMPNPGQAFPGNVMGQNPVFPSSPKLATVLDIAADGFEAWNLMQGTIKEALAHDADFRMALAGAMAKLKHEDIIEKTADGSPLISYLENHGGPLAVRSLVNTLRSNCKYANAFLSFYPSVKSVCINDFAETLAPVKEAATVSVVAVEDDYPEDMSDTERTRLVRDGFTIVDRRQPEERSEVFDVAYEKEYSNPNEAGLYDLLLPTGSVARAWIMPAAGNQPGKATVVVEPTNRFFFTAAENRVFVRGGQQDGKSAYDAAVGLDKMEPNSRYVLVNDKGSASAPFRVETVIAENGERVRLRVNIDESIDHRAGRDDTFSNIDSCCEPWDARVKYLQLATHDGRSLVRSGENIVVPANWKALKVVSKWEYEDSVRDSAPDTDTPQTACDEARNAYDAFAPGNPIDVEELMGKNAIHRMLIESADQGISYHIHLGDFVEGPGNYKQAMSRLTIKYGMAVDDAEELLKKAMNHFKARCLIKLAQAVNMPIPVPPGPMGQDPGGMGMPMEDQFTTYQQGATEGLMPRMDSTQPGFAVGGQTETELGGMGVPGIGDDAAMLAQQAAESGQKNVFDHASIGGLARLYDSSAAVDMYMPDLVKALDRIGRILFIFYWKNEDFAERYGAEDLAEMEDLIRGVFKSFGDLVLKLKQKSVSPEDSDEVLAI